MPILHVSTVNQIHNPNLKHFKYHLGNINLIAFRSAIFEMAITIDLGSYDSTLPTKVWVIFDNTALRLRFSNSATTAFRCNLA